MWEYWVQSMATNASSVLTKDSIQQEYFKLHDLYSKSWKHQVLRINTGILFLGNFKFVLKWLESKWAWHPHSWYSLGCNNKQNNIYHHISSQNKKKNHKEYHCHVLQSILVFEDIRHIVYVMLCNALICFCWPSLSQPSRAWLIRR